MKKEEKKESEITFDLDANLVDLDNLPDVNVIPITNELRRANIKMEIWMPTAIGICNSIALKEGVKLENLRKANQAIIGKMVESDKELSGNDYLKAFERIMARNGIEINLADIEYTSRRIINE